MSDDKIMTTYRRADGELIAGEYRLVTDTDYFDDDDDSQYLEVVEERWALESSRVLKLGDTSRLCYECDEDIELPEPVDGPVYCPEHKAGGG